jgi:hypothetical protein
VLFNESVQCAAGQSALALRHGRKELVSAGVAQLSTLFAHALQSVAKPADSGRGAHVTAGSPGTAAKLLAGTNSNNQEESHPSQVVWLQLAAAIDLCASARHRHRHRLRIGNGAAWMPPGWT